MFTPKRIEIPKADLDKYYDIFWNKSDADFYINAEFGPMQNRMSEQGVEAYSLLGKQHVGAFGAPYVNDLSGADIVMYGLTMDKCSPNAAGHKFGPDAIRDASKTGMGLIHQDGTMPFELCNIIDYGNWDGLGHFNLDQEMRSAQEIVDDMVINHKAVPFFFGGDHTIAYPGPSALAKVHGPISLIHIDGHFDLLTRKDFDYEANSGNWYMRLASEGAINPASSVSLGMRGRWCATQQGKAKAVGGNFYLADEIYDLGVDHIVDVILEKMGDGRPVYLTFDLDGLDMLDHSANSSPDPFGVSARMYYDIFRKLRATKRINLVGADIAEFAPQKNDDEKDALLTAAFGWEFLVWLAECRHIREDKKNPTKWPMNFGRNIEF
ncbi:arginase family protein [Paraferrimonas sp. SM1919]|uniref:arginase family protein n=1 Tax=Paraferrimonas sp. SM1919 TaxID=2662263 RepID=UPI0013D87F57|nr:arginase family protein [Paraferrimonas sp. SM1919]